MSNPRGDVSTTARTWCPDCGRALDRKGICWNCYDIQENVEPPEELEYSVEIFKSYAGGRWIVDGLIRQGDSEAEAIAEVQNPSFIRIALDLGSNGLMEILADRYASEALRQLLLANDAGTLTALSGNIRRLLNGGHRRRRGPKAKAGAHIQEQVLRMKRDGKTNGQIARALGTKKSTVAAAYNNITNEIAQHQRQGRANNSAQ